MPDTALTTRPVRPTGNSTTRSSTRSRTSSASRRWALPVPAIRRRPRTSPSAMRRRRRCTDASSSSRAALVVLGRADRVPAGEQVVRGRRPAISGGSSAWQRSRAYGAARGERAARRRVDEVGRAAGDRRQPGVRRRPRAWGCSTSAPRCRASSCWRTASLVGAFSTSRPPYITAISSVCPATTPRSWVTRITDMLRSRRCSLDQVEDLRLHRDVEGRGRLVGEQQRRAAGQGDGDHHALAHAARQLVRVLVEAAAGLGDAHVAQQPLGGRPGVCSAHARGGRAAARRSACRSSSAGSATSSGPGRSSPSPGPRCGASACGVRSIISWPSNRTDPVRSTLLPVEQAHDRARQHRLARAGLADDAERLAAVEGER